MCYGGPSENMRVLSVFAGTPSGEADWWRAENLARLMESLGYDVEFLHYVRWRLGQRALIANYSWNHILVGGLPITFHLKHLRILLKGHYDVVYANANIAAFYSALGRSIGVPLIFDMHGDVTDELLLYRERKAFDPKLKCMRALWMTIDAVNFRMADAIICVSRSMMSYLNNKGVSMNKMYYVPNGVDLDFFKPPSRERVDTMKERLGLKNRMVFGYIGGSQKWQGTEILVKVAEKCQDKDVGFLIVGTKESRRLDNMLLLPWVKRKEVSDYYSACDVLVLPRPRCITTQVAAPTKFAEYAAMGKPILASDVGDPANLIREYHCGIVVDRADVENIASGVETLKMMSPRELEEMGRNSRKLAVEQFDWKRIAKEVEVCIEKSVNGP